MDTDLVAKIVAPTVGLFSLIIAFLAFLLNRANHRLNKMDRLGAGPALLLQLREARGYVLSDRRHWQFAYLIINESDKPNSVASAELEITYLGRDGYAHVVKLPAIRHYELTESISDVLDVPFTLGAREAKAGSLIFEAPLELLKHRSVDRYEVVLRDAHGLQFRHGVAIVPEIRKHGNENAVKAEAAQPSMGKC